MVWFACGCGETLKKKQVDSHAKWCSECWSVACIDCGVSFPGNEYASHNQCITESEKHDKGYGRGGGKHSGKNGSVKSNEKLSAAEAWARVVADAASGAPFGLQGTIEKLKDSRNAVPRQKNKFINFVRNSLNIRSDATIQALWTHLEGLKNKVLENQKDCSTSSMSHEMLMENGNCNCIVNLSLGQVNDVDVENTQEKESEGKQQQVPDPAVESGSRMESDTDATIRSKRKRDRENKVFQENFELEISVKQMKKVLKQIVKKHHSSCSREEQGTESLSIIPVRALTKEAAAQLAHDGCPTTQKRLLRKKLRSVVYSGVVKGIKEIKNKQATLTGGTVRSSSQ